MIKQTFKTHPKAASVETLWWIDLTFCQTARDGSILPRRSNQKLDINQFPPFIQSRMSRPKTIKLVTVEEGIRSKKTLSEHEMTISNRAGDWILVNERTVCYRAGIELVAQSKGVERICLERRFSFSFEHDCLQLLASSLWVFVQIGWHWKQVRQ